MQRYRTGPRFSIRRLSILLITVSTAADSPVQAIDRLQAPDWSEVAVLLPADLMPYAEHLNHENDHHVNDNLSKRFRVITDDAQEDGPRVYFVPDRGVKRVRGAKYAIQMGRPTFTGYYFTMRPIWSQPYVLWMWEDGKTEPTRLVEGRTAPMMPLPHSPAPGIYRQLTPDEVCSTIVHSVTRDVWADFDAAACQHVFVDPVKVETLECGERRVFFQPTVVDGRVVMTFNNRLPVKIRLRIQLQKSVNQLRAGDAYFSFSGNPYLLLEPHQRLTATATLPFGANPNDARVGVVEIMEIIDNDVKGMCSRL